jgi:hypothetical protein
MSENPANLPAKPSAQPPAAPTSLKITSTSGPKICKPFVLQVMVFAPGSGFKIQVDIERSCTPQADALWKIVFDLYKQSPDGSFVQLVHVSYTGGTPVEQQGLQTTAINGVNSTQADIVVNRVGPDVLDLQDVSNMTQEQLDARKASLKSGLSDVAKAGAVKLDL